MLKPHTFLIGIAAFAGFPGSALAQDVQGGITAWQAGDYAQAIQIWRPLADRGDADAQFNVGQAYRLGRGVPQNLNLAEQWFERAARQRHEQAGASLGLLLFQNGRAREAMPWLQAAAGRGDPRAQYVFGTALFNGDIVRRDLPRAYAMMSAAASQGFPQAQQQLGEMERQLSPEDRQRGQEIAAQLNAGPAPTQVAEAGPGPRPSPQQFEPQPQRPTGPGVSYNPPPEQGWPEGNPPPDSTHRTPPQEQRTPVTRPPRPRPATPAPTQRTVRTTRPAAAPIARGGSWRVQIGAFSSEAGARSRWNAARSRVSALRSLSVSFQRAGSVTRVRAGTVANRAAADRVCSSVRAAGFDCIPVAP